MYSSRLNEGTLSCFQYAVLLHLLIGCWVFSSQNSLGVNMFPRPVERNSQIIAISETAFNPTATAGLCRTLSTVKACLAASTEGCVWISSTSNYSCILDPAAGGPLQPLPRLFNDLIFPYFLFTILCAAGILVQWTPLWPFVWAVSQAGLNLLSYLFPSRNLKNIQEDTGNKPTYSLALQKGHFENTPPGYDLTLISPYDEVIYRLGNI